MTSGLAKKVKQDNAVDTVSHSFGATGRRSQKTTPNAVDGNHAILRKIESAQLKVSQPGDKHEREADRVADHVMRMSHVPERTSSQRVGDSLVKRPNIRTSSVLVPSGGEPLPRRTREFFERRFGQDLSHVRIHNNPRAVDAADAVNARAYTTGQDIVFGAGEYSPYTNAGRELIAHELVHVAQNQRYRSTGGDRPRAFSVVATRAVQRQTDNREEKGRYRSEADVHTPKQRPKFIPAAEPTRKLSVDEQLVLTAREQNRALRATWTDVEATTLALVEEASARLEEFVQDFEVGHVVVRHYLAAVEAERNRVSAYAQVVAGALLGAALGGLGPLVSAVIAKSYLLQTAFSAGASMVAEYVTGATTDAGGNAERISQGIRAPEALRTEGLHNLNGVLKDHARTSREANSFFAGQDALLDKVIGHIYTSRRPLNETRDGRQLLERALQTTSIHTELRTDLAEMRRSGAELLRAYRSIPYRYPTGNAAEERRIWIAIIAENPHSVFPVYYAGSTEMNLLERLASHGIIQSEYVPGPLGPGRHRRRGRFEEAYNYAKAQKPIDDRYYAEVLLAMG